MKRGGGIFALSLTHCIKPVIQDKIEMIMKTKPFSLLSNIQRNFN